MIKQLTTLSMATILLASTTTNAATSSEGDMYIKLQAGGTKPHQAEYKEHEAKSASSMMESLTANGGAALGYHILPNIRVEAGVDYNHSLKYQYAIQIPGSAALSTTAKTINRDYNMSVTTPMVKGFYDIPLNTESTNFYLGVGVGYSFISGSTKINEEKEGAEDTQEIEGRNFAGVLLAGISHKISDGVTGELGYQFGYHHDKPKLKISGKTEDKGQDLFNLITHSVNVGVRFAL